VSPRDECGSWRGRIKENEARWKTLGQKREKDLGDLFLIRAEEDYFSVFHALAPKIGLLGPLGSEVVLVYAAPKSLLEDMKYLRDEGQAYPEGRKNAIPDQVRGFLLQQTAQINGLSRETTNLAVQAVAGLGAFAQKRWFKVFK
jgi:hypothetical protein